ncbi:MAG: hypothetical protein GY805_01330 [Chloroflexi bacterium]|nr:hypothetical protein [Chloroflexota bacterium]
MKLNKQYTQFSEMIAHETAVSPHKPITMIIFLAITLLVTIFWFMYTQPASAAVDCANNTWQVGDEADLNGAITCFNDKATAGNYSIIFTQNISLTASTTAMSNNTANATLLLEGADFTVDGQGIGNVRPFEIATNTGVVMQNITIIGGNALQQYSDGGGIYNRGTLVVKNSSIRNNYANNYGGGGGIYSNGTLIIMNSTVSDNFGSYGGGIHNRGTLTITNSIFSNNSANTGGALQHSSPTNTVTTISNSTISNNTASYGGGISNSDRLIITNSTINSNSATWGGGIDNWGNLTLKNSTLSNNNASYGGGIMTSSFGITNINHSTINDNSATNGGGIYNGGTIYINNSIIANSNGNDCDHYLGTIHNQGHNIVEDGSCIFPTGGDPNLGSLQDNGGDTFTHALLAGSPAIDAGDTTSLTDQRGISRPQGNADDIGAFEVYDCTAQPWLADSSGELSAAITCYNAQTAANSYTVSVTQNITLTKSNLAIDNTTAGVELLLEGNGYTVDGRGIEGIRPFQIATDTAVTILNISIIGGHVDKGGGIDNNGLLTIDNSTIRDNTANDFGGGIASAGILTVSNSSISGNSAYNGGGIINEGTLNISNSTVSDNLANYGGGIYNSYGTLTTSNSTISGNFANDIGGGIRNASGTITVSNSTISNNSTNNIGGGIASEGILAVSNSTISGNSAINGGGIINYDASVATINNSIVANSINGGDCINTTGTITDGGYNLIEDDTNSCGLTNGNNNIIGEDPLLGSLQNNGGDLLTHALLAGSPAIDAGNSAETTDQRGTSRPQGNADDIGAFEVIFFTLSVTKEGTGSGMVTSTPAALDCGAVCTVEFAKTSTITLTATADTGHVFIGWSGEGCSDTAVCIVTMDEAKTVTTTFNFVGYTIFLPFVRK